jgi:hypothetical protein
MSVTADGYRSEFDEYVLNYSQSRQTIKVTDLVSQFQISEISLYSDKKNIALRKGFAQNESRLEWQREYRTVEETSKYQTGLLRDHARLDAGTRPLWPAAYHKHIIDQCEERGRLE